MTVLALLLFGSAGVGQYMFLRALSMRITGIRSGSPFPFLLGKLVLYGVMALLLFTLFRPFLLWAGIGYAAGMGLSLLAGILQDRFSPPPSHSSER